MQEKQQFKNVIDALQEIEKIGTHYPPNWEMYSEEQKLLFPPVRTKEAKIAFNIIAKLNKKILKHIETLPAVDARIMIDQGLEHLVVEHGDMTTPFDCYFCPVTGNLWHCYLGTTELYNVLSATVIAALEREFAPLCV